MAGDSSIPKKRGNKQKYYAVRVGRIPNVYETWEEAEAQVTDYKGNQHKSFNTREEAEAWIREGASPISLKGHLTAQSTSTDAAQSTSTVTVLEKASKKQKKNDGSAQVTATSVDYAPGYGPLPENAEDGFDPGLKMNTETGTVERKTEAELNARKMQPTGDFDGPLVVFTDGATKSNGKLGAYGGVGVWFGRTDPRNLSEALAGARQTNQRAELTAISRALDIVPIDRSAIIITDSNYAKKCLTEYFPKWRKNEWKLSTGKPVENRDLIEPMLERMDERACCKATTTIEWVRGHNGIEGNEGADRLANEGAEKKRLEIEQQKALEGSTSSAANAKTLSEGLNNAHALSAAGAKEGQAQINGILEGEQPILKLQENRSTT